jgi:hypothetical protein
MARQLIRFVVAAGLVLASRPDSASAQVQGDPVPSAARREVRGQVGASINNAGLQNTLDVSWTRPTSRSHHPLLAGAHIATGLTNAITPSQAKLGGWIEYSPLSILDLRAGIDPSVYFGTFDSLMGLASYEAPFDPKSRKALGGATTGVSARAYLAPVLKFKAGPIVASTGAEFEWWRSSADGEFFYEPTRDTVLKSAGDQLITTTSVLMYQWTTGASSLSVGALHTLARVSDAPGNNIQKLGVLAVKQFGAAHYGLPQPRLTVLVARYLDDPSKEGQWTAAIAVGFRKGRR